MRGKIQALRFWIIWKKSGETKTPFKRSGYRSLYMAIEVRITVNFGGDYKRLLKIIENVRELSELVPEWSQYEAEQLTDEILELAKDSTNTKVKR